jgi:hypothetical protein
VRKDTGLERKDWGGGYSRVILSSELQLVYHGAGQETGGDEIE